MYRYDAIDEELLADRAAEFRDQVRAPPGRRAHRGPVQAAAADERPLSAAARLHAAGRHPLWHAERRASCARWPGSRAPTTRATATSPPAPTSSSTGSSCATRPTSWTTWPRSACTPSRPPATASATSPPIPYAGATAEEVDDPRVWAEAIRQWSTFHPEFTYLPRKFKIAVTAAAKDRTAAKIHDIGLRLRRDARRRAGLRGAWSAAAWAARPIIGPTIREHLPARRLLSYLEAILRVYNRHGRRDNIFKARIKILVAPARRRRNSPARSRRNGRRSTRRQVDLPDTELARIRAAFAPTGLRDPAARSRRRSRRPRPPIRPSPGSPATTSCRTRCPATPSSTSSLKAPGETPGDATAEQMEVVADLAERYSPWTRSRVTHEQNLVLPHVKLDDLPAVHAALEAAGPGHRQHRPDQRHHRLPGPRLLRPGQRPGHPDRPGHRPAVRRPGPWPRQVGELKIKISGCINACGHHHVGHIGILGVDKKGEEFYQLTLGGSGAEDAERRHRSWARPCRPTRWPRPSTQLVEAYLRERQDGERFLDTFRRTGLAPVQGGRLCRSSLG